MQIILQEDVEKLGTRGQVVEVAEGYARNFLLPRKLAMPASAGNLKRLEKIRTTLAKLTATERDAAQKVADALNSVVISLVAQSGRERSHVRLRNLRRSRRTNLPRLGIQSTSAKSNWPSQSARWANIKYR